MSVLLRWGDSSLCVLSCVLIKLSRYRGQVEEEERLFSIQRSPSHSYFYLSSWASPPTAGPELCRWSDGAWPPWKGSTPALWQPRLLTILLSRIAEVKVFFLSLFSLSISWNWNTCSFPYTLYSLHFSDPLLEANWIYIYLRK
jgi:hypothetical protein